MENNKIEAGLSLHGWKRGSGTEMAEVRINHRSRLLMMRQLFHNHPMLLGLALAVLAGCVHLRCSEAIAAEADAKNASLSTDAAEIKRQRKESAHRPRRIIMNNDGSDALVPAGEPHTHENFLSKRTTALAGTQVDTIFYCTGAFNNYTHHSAETELRIIPPRMRGSTQLEEWGWELGQKGPDTLATIVDFGHKHNIEIFWSMRMNDTHDSAESSHISQWKLDHPECLMGKRGDRFPAGGGIRWSALNYEMPEVREKAFRILCDVATRYDVDGLELDFFRHPIYFKPQMFGKPVTQQQCDMITDLLRQVRAMADDTAAKRGRPMLIAVRVPDSIEYTSAIGLDLIRWLQDDLIDILIVGGYFQLNPWETSVKLGHQYEVPVYPSLSEPRFENAPSQRLRASLECYRGRALEAWNAGADGIYMFNYFNPHSALWCELGDPAKLQTLDQCYLAGAMATKDIRWVRDGRKWLNRPTPLPEEPVAIAPGETAMVEISVAATVGEPHDKTRTIRVQLLPSDASKTKPPAVTLNDRPLPDGVLKGGWFEYSADLSMLKQGVNRLQISVPPEGSDTTISDAAIWIRHRPKKTAKKVDFSVEDFDFGGSLGSDDVKIEKVGANHFKVALGHAPKHPDWPNMLQFCIRRHAKGNTQRLDVSAPAASEDYPFDKYFCSWSYDGRNGQPIRWQTHDGQSMLLFPEFGEERVTVGHQVPLSADDIERMVSRWRELPCVDIHKLGKSVNGRPIYRSTQIITEEY